MPDNVEPFADGEAAVADADVVITLTNARAAFIGPGMLKEGALLLSMGSAHEVEMAVLDETGPILVDDLEYACAQGDIAAWMREGRVNEAQLDEIVRGTFGEMLAGTVPGRTNASEKIMVIVQGLTACDVAIARSALELAGAARGGHTSIIPPPSRG
jgi:ornithine cyclodeaminase/alanine dehydrogenase-like protein (mu-crystallin family)